MQNEKAQGLKDGLVKLIEALATDTDEAPVGTVYFVPSGGWHVPQL